MSTVTVDVYDPITVNEDLVNTDHSLFSSLVFIDCIDYISIKNNESLYKDSLIQFPKHSCLIPFEMLYSIPWQLTAASEGCRSPPAGPLSDVPVHLWVS